MTLWAECKQKATNVCFRHEPNADDPWKMLAGAVILQSLIDYMRGADRMDDNDYRFYADIAGIERDYISLLQDYLNRYKWWNPPATATAWLDSALKKGW